MTERSRGKKTACKEIALEPIDFVKLHQAWENYVKVLEYVEGKYSLPKVKPVEPRLKFVPAA